MNKSAVLLIAFISLNVYGSNEVVPKKLQTLDTGNVAPYSQQNGKLTETLEKETLKAGVDEKNTEKEIDEIKQNQSEFSKNIEKLNDGDKFDYALWASILLGCVTIIITLISVFLALISIVGYRNFKKSIELTVQRISTSVAQAETTKQIDGVAKKELARLIDEGALAKHLESAVDMVYLRLRGRPDDSKDGFNKYPELDDEEHEK